MRGCCCFLFFYLVPFAAVAGAAEVETARLANIATRAAVGGVAGTPIPGFVLGGAGTKPIIVRAVGPTLGGFGVSGVLADPQVNVVSDGAVVATNDNWSASDAPLMVAAGGFALSSGSKDAVLVTSLGAGAYSAPVTAADGGEGIALVEVYDGSRGSGPSIVNASTRAFVGTGERVLVSGFVISGTGSLRLLVRAVGPTLTGFGVPGAIADPTIALYRGTVLVATNDTWWTAGNAGQMMATAAAVGAFPLGFESRDAAVLASLEPGAYSAVFSGGGGATGTGLVELYAVPPTPAVLGEGQWGVRADLPEPNSEMSVAELEGKIYVIGGYPSNRVSVRTVQVYDIATDTWRLTTPLPVGLNHTVSAGVAGKLYVIGGQISAGGAGPFVDTVYVYDPATGTWATRAKMPTQRGGGAGAVVGGKIYVAGGRPPRGSDFAVYDPAVDAWGVLPDLPTQRNHVGAAAIDGKIYVVGGRLEAGFQSAQTDRVEIYDPMASRWTTGAPMLRPRGGVNAVAALGYLHVFGGEGNDDAASGVYPDHDVYHPATNTWVRLRPMPVPVHGVTGASFVNGMIHLTGGGIADGGENGTTLHQVFRPAGSYR